MSFPVADRLGQRFKTTLHGSRFAASRGSEWEKQRLGPDGTDTISATARMIHYSFWSKRSEERWKPKSAKAVERKANPPRTKLAVKPVGKNHRSPLVHP